MTTRDDSTTLSRQKVLHKTEQRIDYTTSRLFALHWIYDTVVHEVQKKIKET